MAVPNKVIKLKDKTGNYLTPVLIEPSRAIAEKTITKSMLAEDVQKVLDGSATDANLQQIQNDITTLKGDSTVEGSVAKSVSDAKNSVMSYVNSSCVQKADFNTQVTKITTMESTVSAVQYAIATNAANITALQNGMLYYEEVTQA